MLHGVRGASSGARWTSRRVRAATARVGLAALVVAVGVLGVGSPSAAAPDRADAAGKFAARRRAILVAAGTDRVRLGIWCRDSGLVSQASASFVRAVEESEGTNLWAVRVLELLRRLDDKFWKTVKEKPSKAYLDTFEKKSRKLDEALAQDLFRLAKDGHKAGLLDEAVKVWSDLVRDTDRPLEVDATGHVVLPSGVVPEDASARIRASAITVNGKLYLRDAFLELVPKVTEIREAAGDKVRVRIQGDAAAPDDLLASLEALMPFLEDDLGGRPTHRINVFVFQDRASYVAWLDGAKLPGFASASGLADGATNTAIVCAAGIGADAVRGMCMHEMSHLFMYAVTPVVMPSWYAEGFAETYGGDGTFRWEGGKLSAGGPMPDGALESVRSAEGYLPLADLLAGDALKALAKDRAAGRRFYVESWAFLRFLRTAATPDVQARFRLWETYCRGAALGAQAGKPREQDASPAAADFSRRFGPELPALESAFQAYLAAGR